MLVLGIHVTPRLSARRTEVVSHAAQSLLVQLATPGAAWPPGSWWAEGSAGWSGLDEATLLVRLPAPMRREPWALHRCTPWSQEPRLQRRRRRGLVSSDKPECHDHPWLSRDRSGERRVVP